MTRSPEIEALLRSGERLKGAPLFDIRKLESPGGRVRVAIVVPRFGHTAVRRNRLKRQLRELARLHLVPAGASVNLLVRARRESYDASFGVLRDAITRLAAQL